MHLTADDCRLVMLLIETSQLDEDKEAAWELHHRIQRSRGMSIVTHDEAENALDEIAVNVELCYSYKHTLDDYITQQRTREAEQQAEIERLRDALQEIALAGMSPSPEMSENGVEAWRARQAWRFIGIAARAISPDRAALNTEGAKG